MSNIPQEDIALAAEKLSDDEIIVSLLRTVSGLGMELEPNIANRMKEIGEKYQARIPLRRKLEKNPELARELIADYPIYASTSGLSHQEMIDICVAINLDEAEEE